jgi:membrane protease subunit HflK
MRMHLPWPIETAYTLEVTRQRQINIGYRTAADSEDGTAQEDISAEADMLTGDENIIDVNFTVGWLIKDAGDYLFNVEDPESTIKAVGESAMREIVGRSQFQNILTQDRETIQLEVKDLMQKTLDSYGTGVIITNVNMQKADPPGEVIAAYRDVQAARADQERLRNEAEGYANKVIPEARGRAARIVQDAEGYRQQMIAEASGQSRRFLSILAQYRSAPDITRRRIYLETMTGVLATMNKVIVDDSAKGVVPYFQLPSMLGARQPATTNVPSDLSQGSAP